MLACTPNSAECCLINTDDFAILPYNARQTGIRIIQLRGNLILQSIKFLHRISSNSIKQCRSLNLGTIKPKITQIRCFKSY